MKARLLLSAAAIAFAAMSPAIAETVIIPVVPGSLDGASSTTGDGGPGGPASATADSPSNSTNSAFRDGGAGGSGGNNGGAGGGSERIRDHDNDRRLGKRLEPLERDGRRRGFWRPVYLPPASAAMAEPRPRPPSPPRPAPRGPSRRSRPLQEASAGVHPSAQLGRAGETAAMRPLQLWRSAAAVRSTCRPAQSAATAVSGAARAARPGYRTAGQWSGCLRPVLHWSSRCSRISDGRKRRQQRV